MYFSQPFKCLVDLARWRGIVYRFWCGWKCYDADRDDDGAGWTTPETEVCELYRENYVMRRG